MYCFCNHVNVVLFVKQRSLQFQLSTDFFPLAKSSFAAGKCGRRGQQCMATVHKKESSGVGDQGRVSPLF